MSAAFDIRPGDLSSRTACNHFLANLPGDHRKPIIVNAFLRALSRASYLDQPALHFGLGKGRYCHFTSPIRRYPDLTVHRLVADLCRGTLDRRAPDDVPGLVELGEQCSAAERDAEAAEDEVRTILLLQHLETKLGERFDGVITGVTNFGVFVQLPRYLIDGLIRMENLGDDWWELDARRGVVKGERTGQRYRIGDMLGVVIASVDVPSRKIKLSLAEPPKGGRRRRRSKGGRKSKGGSKSGRSRKK
jgi:ribonuclease R